MTTRASRINWRREAIFPAQALAESILLAAWLLVLLNIRHITPERAVSACLLVALGTLYLTRAMEALHVSTALQRLCVLVGLTALTTLALNWAVFDAPRWADWAWLRHPLQNANALIRFLPETVIVILALTWLVWRGVELAEKPISAVETTRSFQAGLIAFALLVVANTGHDITFYIPAYFFAQLLAIGLARVESMANERGGRRSPFNVWWLATLVGAVGLVVMAGGIVSVAVLGIGPERLIGWVWPVLSLILVPFVILLSPIILLVGIVAEAFFRNLLKRLDAFTPLTDLLRQLPEQKQPEPMNPTWQRVFEVGGPLVTMLIVIAIVVAVIWIALRRRAGNSNDEAEEHESMWSGRALLRKLRARLQHRLARLRQWADIAGRFGADGLLAALTIRRVYAQTVKLAASRGYPRLAARTPYEHLVTLQLAFAGCESDLRDITEAYVGVHYGELPEQPEALAHIRAAFERIKAAAAQEDKKQAATA
jgi:hypothetical protein